MNSGLVEVDAASILKRELERGLGRSSAPTAVGGTVEEDCVWGEMPASAEEE